jgi:predicted MFS family arabinose efflux permease
VEARRVGAAAAGADRRFALSVWSTYMPAGAGLAMALSPLLLPTTGWRGLWALTSAVLVAAALAAWWQRRWYAPNAAGNPTGGHTSGPTSGHTGTPVATLAVLRQPLPWLLALGFGLWAVQHFALIVWLPTMLKEQRGLSSGWVALLTCVMLLACVPGNLLGGVLVQRGVARGRLLTLAHTATGLTSLAFFLDGLPDGVRYAACVACSFIGGVMPAAVMSSSAVLARSPRQINALQGLFIQGSQLGQFAGTPLIAAVVAASGRWSSAGWVSASAALMGVALGLVVWRIERGQGAAR